MIRRYSQLALKLTLQATWILLYHG